MSDAFFLLILPLGSLTIHLGSYQRNVGMSLRGSCATPANAVHLLQALEQVLENRPPHAWIDCQQLHTLTHLGQQTLRRAVDYAGRLGSTLHWCGLLPTMQHALQATGHPGLHLLPAAGYQGPGFLLPERLQHPTPILPPLLAA
ncbi:STAS domain-containing protein [Hymenobacter psoromatis]|uniref:STAS domain-containing protein n=1 Tax=Hymenobacter psoromatis TaxID=1484116 RepID=UPI001CBB6B71|nr:hypothetical protein [Hymenobacter psoromatis]